MTGAAELFGVDHADAHLDIPPELSRWGDWVRLRDAGTVAPAQPGLYRIRRIGFDGLDYIGQTGAGTMTLRKRLAMLRGVYAEEMPYRDPHTAGPGLWALRHATGCDFEVSITTVEAKTPRRKGLEAVAVSLYRAETGRSPTVNFGRIPVGYQGSSPNNARLVAADRRFRGGPCQETLPSHASGIQPAGPLGGDPRGPAWGAHQWSSWVPAADVAHHLQPAALGLYRLARSDDDSLVYIGEGVMLGRVAAHLAKARAPGHRQGALFAGPVHCSWVANGEWFDHQRLELENDLIASHVLTVGHVPAAQFLG